MVMSGKRMCNDFSKRICLLLVLILISACQINQIKSPAGKQILLANGDQQCQSGESQRLWFLLFGGYQINDVDEKRLFANTNNNNAIRVRQSMDWLDYVITLGGGYAITLNSRTITIENCASSVEVVNRKSEQSRIDQILIKYARAQSTGGHTPIIVLHDGKDLSGKIIEMDSTTLTLEVESDRSISSPNAVYLKNGTILRGKVTGHSKSVISLDTGTDIKKIPKSSIDRIDMTAASQVHFEKRKIPRNKIKTILLRNGVNQKSSQPNPDNLPESGADHKN